MPACRLAINREREQGFLLPLALFVVVAAATLAVAISQMAGGSRTTVLINTLSDQAYYAADAGLEYAAVRLNRVASISHPTKSQSTEAVALSVVCSELDKADLTFDATGLKACRTELQCRESVNTNMASLYFLGSVASCGAGETSSVRVLNRVVRFEK